MNFLEFTAKIVGVLVWPAAIIFILRKYHDEIRQTLNAIYIKKLKAFGVEGEFGYRTEEIYKTIEIVERPAPVVLPPVEKGSGVEPQPEPQSESTTPPLVPPTMADDARTARVLNAWNELTGLIWATYREEGEGGIPVRRPDMAAGAIGFTQEETAAIWEMHYLKDAVANDSFGRIADEDVRRWELLAQKLISRAHVLRNKRLADRVARE